MSAAISQITISKINIRKKIRAQRLACSEEYIKQAAIKSLDHFKKHESKILKPNSAIAFYLPTQNEFPTQQLIAHLSKDHRIYLPILHPHLKRTMWFQHYSSSNASSNALCLNRYGIQEPIFNADKIIAPWELDVVFMPLVGFDHTGSRLGMGGGFYDTTFSKKSHTHTQFIGLAYAFQEIDLIPIEPWDVKLDGVLTEQKIITF